jgi:Holliday junction DNA helicase RuvA
MISYLTGKIIYLGPNHLELLVNNLGYEVFLPTASLTTLHLGQSLTLFVYHHLAEDKNQLFGFLDRRDKEVFHLLLTVAGVGPKTALSVFNAGSGDRILEAVQKAEVPFFQQIKGLGLKTAQRIIVDLKNKAGSLKDLNFQASNEVVQTLRQLGFKHDEIRTVWLRLPPDLSTTEEKLKFALKNLSRPVK